MKKRVYQTLGIDMDVKNLEKNKKTLNTLLSTLIEHNTVQVINMLFAKPRQILYSPDMRIKFLSASSKWAFFQLEKPEVISKRAFKPFKENLMEKITNRDPQDEPLELNKVLPFCVFIISNEPGPKLLQPGKDSANDKRFENIAFAA